MPEESDEGKHGIGRQEGFDSPSIDDGMMMENEKDAQTELTGAFGPWQGIIFTVCGLSVILHGWQMLSNKFLTYSIDHWCERPEMYKGGSIEEWLNISSPLLDDGTFDRCHRFDLDYDQVISRRPKETSPTVACFAWEYKEDLFQVTKNIYFAVFILQTTCPLYGKKYQIRG